MGTYLKSRQVKKIERFTSKNIEEIKIKILDCVSNILNL